MKSLKVLPQYLPVLLTLILATPFLYAVVQYVYINSVSAFSPGNQQKDQTFYTNSTVNYTINNYSTGDKYTIDFNHEFQKWGILGWSYEDTWAGTSDNRDAPSTEPFTETVSYSVSGSFSNAGEYRFKANYNIYGAGSGAGSDTGSSDWTSSFDVQ